MIRCDVLVIGGGGAGLRAAIAAHEAAPSLRVLLATKGELGHSGVTATACSDRMAFHATLPTTEPGGPDAWRYHAADIYRLGGQVSDADLADILARESPRAFDYLDRLGVPFARRADGTVDQFLTDGSEHARACYTGPYTAVHIEQALVRRLRELPIEVREHTLAVALLPAGTGERVGGALLLDEQSGQRTVVAAGAVILACGGAGEVFAHHVFPADCTGDGYALAYRAGAELVNLEFIQIGLSSVATQLACSGSLMRALPRLVNEDGREFLPRYFAPGTPLPAVHEAFFAKGVSWPVTFENLSHWVDVAAACERAAGRRVYLEYSANPAGLDWGKMNAGVRRWYEEKGVALDDRPLARLRASNPQSVAWLRERGIDLAAGDQIEVVPAIQHFQGGVKIRRRGDTSLPGLYAAGEVAGGQHGANRPGGNALLDGQVFGRISGEAAAEKATRREKPPNVDGLALQEAQAGLDRLTAGDGLPAAKVRARAQEIAYAAAGLVRTAAGLQAGLAALETLRAAGLRADERGLAYAVETSNVLDVAEMVIRAALLRDESRGPHLRFTSADACTALPRDDERWRRMIVIRRVGRAMELETREPEREA